MKLLYILFEFSFLQQWKLPLGGQQMQALWGFKWLDRVLVSRVRQGKPGTLHYPGPLLLVSFFPAFKMNVQTTLTFFTHTEISVFSKISECESACSNHKYIHFWERLCFRHNSKFGPTFFSCHFCQCHCSSFSTCQTQAMELSSFFQHEDPTSLCAGQILDKELHSQASRTNKLSVWFEV